MTIRILSIMTLFLLSVGCSTRGGNPKIASQVTVQLSTNTSATVSSVALCVSKIVIHPVNPAASAVEITPFNPTFALSPTAETAIASSEVVHQQYDRVDLQLSPDCVAEESIRITNPLGTFGSDQAITAQFLGSFTVSSTERVLTLGMNPIITQLAPVNSASELKTVVEANPGQLQITAPPPISFIQAKEALVNNTSNSISTGNFNSPVTTGNFVICAIAYNSGTANISSMADSAGNTYGGGTGIHRGQGTLAGWSLETWSQTASITGGASFQVTATFTATFSGEKMITCQEYVNWAVASSPSNYWEVFEHSVAISDTVANAYSPGHMTTFPNEMIWGAAFFTTTGSSGVGFNQRTGLTRLVVQDKMVSSIGAYGHTYSNSAQDWMTSTMFIKGR